MRESLIYYRKKYNNHCTNKEQNPSLVPFYKTDVSWHRGSDQHLAETRTWSVQRTANASANSNPVGGKHRIATGCLTAKTEEDFIHL